MRSTLILSFQLLMLLWVSAALAQDRMSREQLRLFESDIRPVLVEHCYECHSADSEELGGGLRLDTRGGLRIGGESGPALVAGRPESSLLLLAMRHADSKLIMPPPDYSDPLPEQVLKDFERWIRAGALDPREDGDQSITYGSEEAQDWWAWKPVQNVEPPAVTDSEWSHSGIDRFVYSKLAESKLAPSPAAERVTLVRRLAIDLTGLPPSFEDLQTYALADPPRALEELVDKYLASERYGERFGRHWLDVARYAESSGKDVNVSYPHAWRYRDYVIDAFNADMPFDQFIKEQIAGDLLSHESDTDRGRHLIATGFLAIGPKGINEMQPRQFAVDVADEQIDAVSQAFLAVTIACARCHDHKFDPVSQKDYTALAGVFLSTQTHYGTGGGVAGRNRGSLAELPEGFLVPGSAREFSESELRRLRERIAELEQQHYDLALERRQGKPQEVNEILRVAQQLVQLNLQMDALDEQGRVKPQAMAVSDKPPPTPPSRFAPRFSRIQSRFQTTRGGGLNLETIIDSPLLVRGETDKPGETIPRGLPAFLASDFDSGVPANHSGRLQLASWIAHDSNPLTSRVVVNRIWSWLLGSGIVASQDNFGTSGELPSHPELLDYLAAKFVNQGWSTKSLVREIVLSKVYQQSSAKRVDAFQLDPENRLLWRAQRKPLDAESLRDGIMWVSGRLELQRPVGSLISAAGDGQIPGRRGGGITELGIMTADPPYRSVYLPVPRNVLPDALELFDFADNAVVSGERDLTIVPSQALYWMNSSSVEEQCRAIADELYRQHASPSRRAPGRGRGFVRQRSGWFANPPNSPLNAKQIEAALNELALSILARPALDEELRAANEYIQSQRNDGKPETSIWTAIVRSLFASADYRFLN